MDQAFAAPLAGATKLSAACKATQSATPAAHRSRVERDRSLNGIIWIHMALWQIIASHFCWSFKSSFGL